MDRAARGALTLACVLAVLACVATPAWAPAAGPTVTPVRLDAVQSHRFRAWFTLIVAEQLRAGLNPRWPHRDCAGLVRFATHEALLRHDVRWRRDNGLIGRPLPAELGLDAASVRALGQWRHIDGTRGPFVTAAALIQANSTFVSRDISQAQPGDLLFFDQGENQHLMIWIGEYIAYHTGGARRNDDGLRAISVHQLLTWRDVRWQLRIDNPNFIGVFRLSFLSH